MLGSLSKDEVLVLDGGAFPFPAVSRALKQMRTAMFTLTEWPAAILLIVGDQAIETATTELASCFYVLPTHRSVAEASLYAYRVHRAAAYARLFRLSQAATGRAFQFSLRVERFRRTIFKRDASDSV
jgi:hypothetical protein